MDESLSKTSRIAQYSGPQHELSTTQNVNDLDDLDESSFDARIDHDTQAEYKDSATQEYDTQSTHGGPNEYCADDDEYYEEDDDRDVSSGEPSTTNTDFLRVSSQGEVFSVLAESRNTGFDRVKNSQQVFSISSTTVESYRQHII